MSTSTKNSYVINKVFIRHYYVFEEGEGNGLNPIYAAEFILMDEEGVKTSNYYASFFYQIPI